MVGRAPEVYEPKVVPTIFRPWAPLLLALGRPGRMNNVRADPKRILAFRHPDQAHALSDTLFRSEECGIVAHRIGKETAASEMGI